MSSEVRAELRARLPAATEGDGAPSRRDGMTAHGSAGACSRRSGVCALLAVWIALSAANVQRGQLLAARSTASRISIVYTDALDFVLRLFMRRRHTATALPPRTTATSRSISPARCPAGARQVVPMRPYAIIASIYNLEPQLDEFMEAFAPWRDKVWLISDGSTDRTVARLRQAGWRCFDDGVNRKKPGAIAPPARAPAAAHRDGDGDRSGHPHPRPRRRQHASTSSVSSATSSNPAPPRSARAS